MKKCLLNVAGCLLIVAMTGCSKDSKDEPATRVDFPERVGSEADATAGESFGLLKTGGSTTVSIDLSKLPAYGSPNLWSCYQFPADDFALGEAVCAADSSKKVVITAANVAFTCNQNPDFANRNPKAGIAVDGCSDVEIFLFSFSPKLNAGVK